MVHLPVLGITTHTRIVQSLYKRTLRNLESLCDRREVLRYHAVIIRDCFDKSKMIQDENEIKQRLEHGEKELFKSKHWAPKLFHYSPGGAAFDREAWMPDWALDYWHPFEKARYPEYFARREMRKKQFVKRWDHKYGPKNKC